MVFDVGVFGFFKRYKTTQEVKKELKWEIEEIKNKNLEVKDIGYRRGNASSS